MLMYEEHSSNYQPLEVVCSKIKSAQQW